MRVLTTEYTDYLINPNEYHLPLLLKKHLFEQLNNSIFSEEQLGAVKSDYVFIINLKTTNNQAELCVTESECKEKEYNWLIEFPYEVIHRSDDRNRSYTELLFNALKQILPHYQVPESTIDTLQDKVLNEITNLPSAYQLHDEELANAQYVRERREEYENED